MAVPAILRENPDRFVVFPIQYHDMWDSYKKSAEAFWTVEKVDLSEDNHHWDTKLNENEKFFISNILSFFSMSDGLIVENMAINFLKEVQIPEARCYYGFQTMMENIHGEMYSLLINTYIRNSEEKDKMFKAIHNNPVVASKANWALNWINSDSFVERLVAFAVVEGIFFSGSFCSIFWLREKGMMPGLCQANDYISLDEASHRDFAVNIYNNHIEEEFKLSEARLNEIILSALEIEKEFITKSLPVSLLGMNSDLMTQYLEYVTDTLLSDLGCSKVFNVQQPFSFMEKIALDNKTNFFERRPTEYNLAKDGEKVSFDSDF